MNRNILAAALAGALVSMSQAAQAAPITLTGSIADNTWLGSGNHGGVFDGKGVLPKNYKINSASYEFNFRDDFDMISPAGATQSGTGYTPYVLQSQQYNGFNYEYTYLRTATSYKSTLFNGEAEGAELSLEGISVGGGSTTMTQTSSTDTIYNGRGFDGYTGQGGYYNYYRCGNFTCSYWVSGSYNNYYSDKYDQVTKRTTDWAGNFAVAGTITNLSLLNQLVSGDALHWNLGVSGDLYLSSARLLLDIDEVKAPASGVPEPSSVMLLGLGLLGLAGIKRRRRPQ